jgi:hypothetical protein
MIVAGVPVVGVVGMVGMIGMVGMMGVIGRTTVTGKGNIRTKEKVNALNISRCSMAWVAVTVTHGMCQKVLSERYV